MDATIANATATIATKITAQSGPPSRFTIAPPA